MYGGSGARGLERKSRSAVVIFAQLTAAMEELAQDSVQRTQMGNHSKERILRYSPEACAAGIAEAALS